MTAPTGDGATGDRSGRRTSGDRSDWPSWATQPVALVAPDPAWPERAAALVAVLEGCLGPWLDGAIEHVGSTAVPGLAAKDLLDLAAPVRSLDDAAGAEPVLAERGWRLVPPDLDERPWRRLYVLPDGDRRVAHLHLVEPTHPRWTEVLAFRDLLRARPDLAAAYADAKHAAASLHPHDREAYTSAKAGFIRGTLGDDPRA